MALLLYFNGQLLDLEPGQVIAQTKQVNDLNSLESRQTNYTNKFKLPKTGRNLKILDFLSVTGNTSTIPYQHNECSLYSETGECFVYKGRAVITDGGEYFNIVLYDGIVELFKAIEGKNLGDLDLSGAFHIRNPQAVLSSWENDLDYRYILANFNGRIGSAGVIKESHLVFLDALVPSIRVKYLWDKIMNKFGYCYSGSVFDTEGFKELWMTFPKGFETDDEGTLLFEATGYNYEDVPNDGFYAVTPSEIAVNNLENFNNYFMTVGETGYYKVVISGKLNTASYTSEASVVKNFQFNANTSSNVKTFSDYIPSGEEDIEISTVLFANESDTLAVRFRPLSAYPWNYTVQNSSDITIKVYKVAAEINFQEALSDFSIKDFLKEIVIRFGLTIFKSKYTNHYEFLTLQETLQTGDIDNWSKKFVKKVSENYVYGDYGQRNHFKYKYNDSEASHNDGLIEVKNPNLPEDKDIIQSKIYSPELSLAYYLNRFTQVYKLWEKEYIEATNDEPERVEYKSLDKRYYFIKAEKEQRALVLLSGELIEIEVTGGYYRDSYHKISFKDVVTDYYQPINRILDRSLIVTAELWLNEDDVANFDFKKLYYIEQLASHFIMNKIVNYVPGTPTKCEMIRVHYTPPAPRRPKVTLLNADVSGLSVSLFFAHDVIKPEPVLPEYSNDGGSHWISTGVAVKSPYTLSVPSKGSYQFRLHDRTENLYSNIISLEI